MDGHSALSSTRSVRIPTAQPDGLQRQNSKRLKSRY
jgi:hypothetical protein